MTAKNATLLTVLMVSAIVLWLSASLRSMQATKQPPPMATVFPAHIKARFDLNESDRRSNPLF